MREIVFRGKSDDEWVFGMLLKTEEDDFGEHKDKHYDYLIQTEENKEFERSKYYITDNETIGQYTGLKDKNGKEIYEGDIVEVSEYNRKRKYIVKFGKYEIECCGCCYSEHLAYGFYLDNKGSINDSDIDELGVIGNIYDNFELLEVQDE